MKESEMRVCSRDGIPLIYTFAFNGAEYWCPYCGYTGGMFGAGEFVPKTAKLFRQLRRYKAYSEKFLAAKSSLICAEHKYKGKWIKPSEMPKRAITIRENIVKNYKYGVKL